MWHCLISNYNLMANNLDRECKRIVYCVQYYYANTRHINVQFNNNITIIIDLTEWEISHI